MTSFQKYLLILLAILVGSVSYYLISATIGDGNIDSSLVKDSNYQTTGQSITLPNEYHVRIVHVGGEGVRNRTTEIIGIGDGDEYYLNEPEYSKNERAPSYMNNGGYIIWLSCKEGYKIKDCWADSDTEVYLDDDGSCGIQIDKMKIFGRLECIKSS